MSLQMSVAEREAFLAGVHVGVIAIPRQSKGPLAVPIWYDYKPGGQPWVITDVGSIKGKLLQKAGRISLCVQEEGLPYKYVSVEGPFSMRPSTDKELLGMAIRYLGEEQGRNYAAQPQGDGPSMAVVVSPESWFTVDYSKMA